jgi:hypothetical protein
MNLTNVDIMSEQLSKKGAKEKAIERLITVNDKHGYYSYNTREQIDLEKVVEYAVECGVAVANEHRGSSERLSFLEDLEMFMKLNEDDFDRGKGMVLLQRFINNQLNKANDIEKEQASDVHVDTTVRDNRRWKNVDESLPENGTIVDIWIVFPNSGHDDGLRITDVVYKDNKFIRDTTDKYRNVTHWRHLPKPPE